MRTNSLLTLSLLGALALPLAAQSTQKPRPEDTEVWEPVPDMPAEQRERLNRLWQAFESGDSEALEALAAIASEAEDAALADFVYRLRQSGPGGHFVLGSK